MLSLHGEEWTEWNIKPAVLAWKESPNKNFGLSVIVEDEDGTRLPVDKLFSAMNCSNEACECGMRCTLLNCTIVVL